MLCLGMALTGSQRLSRFSNYCRNTDQGWETNRILVQRLHCSHPSWSWPRETWAVHQSCSWRSRKIKFCVREWDGCVGADLLPEHSASADQVWNISDKTRGVWPAEMFSQVLRWSLWRWRFLSDSRECLQQTLQTRALQLWSGTTHSRADAGEGKLTQFIFIFRETQNIFQLALFHSISNAYLQYQRKSDPSWSWRKEFPQLSSFLDDIDSSDFIKDVLPKGLEMIKNRYEQYAGSNEERILLK